MDQKSEQSLTQSQQNNEAYSSPKIIKNINDKLPPTLSECTSNHIQSLILYHQSFDDKIIDVFKNKIVTFIQKNEMNGQFFLNIKRKQFSEKLIKYIGNNNKIRGAGNKTWDKLTKYQFHSASKQVLRPPSSIIVKQNSIDILMVQFNVFCYRLRITILMMIKRYINTLHILLEPYDQFSLIVDIG